ncbi:MAG: hypothetical protein LCH38_09820 [Proteobacteria bacterium]|nr:hypothetical protein [Pseudomonadota bacterium]
MIEPQEQIARINLNVFSNVASRDAADCLVPEAIASYLACFDGERGARETIIRVFCDPKPHRANFPAWIEAIRAGTQGLSVEIVESEGLIDSFARSIVMSECDYAMQLEHDFVFLKKNIPHSISEMVAAMRAGDIDFLRFNKRRNIAQGYDLFLDEARASNVPMCRVNGRSNNPQIIRVDYYREVVYPIIAGPKGQEIGLEGGLCRFVGGGHLYGPLGWPRTVQHLDGRAIRWRDGIARRLHLMKSRARSRAFSDKAGTG